MRASLAEVLVDAAASRQAVAACNVYTLDQAAGVIDAAQDEDAPIILQLHPSGLGSALWSMAAGVRTAADAASVPCVVHLDHCADLSIVERAAQVGFDSVMVDGSALPIEQNMALVARARDLVGGPGIGLEAEIGRLTGTEDGLTIDARRARLTDPAIVSDYVGATGVVALAASIGNVHGETTTEPALDLERLAAIQSACPVPLVLHGASGLSPSTLRAVIALGVAKVNVNTELRRTYVEALVGARGDTELVELLRQAREAVRVRARSIIATLRAE